MFLLSIIFSAIFLVVLGYSMYKPTIGFPLFLAYVILVPITRLQLGSFYLGENLLYLLLPLSLYLKYGKSLKKVDFRPIKPFFFLYIVQLILIPFQESVEFGNAIGILYRNFMQVVVFPASIFALMQIAPESIQNFKRALLGSGFIVVIYGLYLVTMPGVNPYLMIILPIWGGEFNEAYALGYSALTENYSGVVDGRMFGRISSVFAHPMTYALYLGFIMLLCIYLFSYNKKIILLSTLLIIVAILTCGVRSAIGALIITALMSLLIMRKFKFALGAAFVAMVFVLIISSLSSDLYEYVASIFSDNSSNVSGSSLQMRLEQLDGCFEIIKDSPLQGMGYNWTGEYMAKHTIHPVVLCFESIVFVVLCNTGFIGAIAWIIVVIWFYRNTLLIPNRFNQVIILCIFVYFLSFAGITGDYGYQKIFMMFYSVILGCMLYDTKTFESLRR